MCIRDRQVGEYAVEVSIHRPDVVVCFPLLRLLRLCSAAFALLPFTPHRNRGRLPQLQATRLQRRDLIRNKQLPQLGTKFRRRDSAATRIAVALTELAEPVELSCRRRNTQPRVLYNEGI